MRIWQYLALALAALAFSFVPAQAQFIGIPGGGSGPCSAFGTIAGTCLQGAGALGTPSSGTGTNLTGIPISTGLTGAGTGVLTALGVNVGSAGAVVVNGGALGTPASGTATNLTGLPLATGISGLGAGVATLLGGASSGTGGPAGTASPTFTGTLLAAAQTNSGAFTLSALSGTNCLQEVSGLVGSFGSPCTPNGLGAVTAISVTPSAADFAAFKTFVLNGNTLDVKVPVSTTLQANGGGYLVIAEGTSDTITVTSPDTITYGSTTSGAGGNQPLTQGGLYLVLTDGAGKIYSSLVGAGGSYTAPTIFSTSIASGSTNNTLGAGTFNGAITNSTNGASAAPAFKMTGTIFTGGGTTNTQGLVQIKPASGVTAPTGLDNNGVMVEIDEPDTFAGTVIQAFKNNAQIFALSNDGIISGKSFSLNSAGVVGFNARAQIYSPADAQLLLQANNGTTAFDIIQFGNTSASYIGLMSNGLELDSELADKSGPGNFGFLSLVSRGATPTITGTCTSGTKVGGQAAGTFVATCTAQTIILTFTTTAPNGWNCDFKDRTTPADLINQASSTTTSCTTASSTTAASDVVQWRAQAYLIDPGMVGSTNDKRRFDKGAASY